ncbi:MAG: M50 family metallopeptidase [Pseudomonadota bacterium]
MSYFRGHWQLIALTGVVFALWQTQVVLPLKLLVVFFHEFAHGAAAVLTGGEVLELSVSAQQGGYAVTRGGSRFWILSAGYLGSLVIGLSLLLAALRSRADRAILGGLGALMILCCVLFIRESFALVFCAFSGAAMMLAAWVLPRQVCDLILRVIGVTSLLYAPYDIFDDTIRRAALRSDARMLAEEVGGTTLMWGGLWLAVSALVILAALRFALAPHSNLSSGR